MKKILAFLLILSTLIFTGCANNVTNSSNTDNTGGTGSTDENTQPDGIAADYDGTWYFYSEDCTVKDLAVTVGNGGITGLKTSSGSVIDFTKDNLNSKVIHNNPLIMLELGYFADYRNYMVYKDGNTGNITFKDKDIGHVKIKDASGNIIIEGILSKNKKSTTITVSIPDFNYIFGTYNGTFTSSTSGNVLATVKIIVANDKITFERTTSSENTTLTIPAAYIAANGDDRRGVDALNYINNINSSFFNFPFNQFTVYHSEINFSCKEGFTDVQASVKSRNFSHEGYEYTKEGEQQ